MCISIRIAQPEDAELLRKLAFNIYPAHFNHMWLSASEMNTYLESEFSLSALNYTLKDPGVCWFIAETDKPVGLAKLTWIKSIPDTAISGVSLDRFYLAPEQTGKQLGRRLFKEIITIVQKKGMRFLWLQVREQNRRARQFYEVAGMRHITDTLFRTESQVSTLHIMGIDI